jgi:hypothetical protein
VSTFSENSNVPADQPKPQSITSPDGVLAGNAPAFTSEDATNPTSQPITASMNDQESLRQEACAIRATPILRADLNLTPSGETTSAEKPAPSEEAATSPLNLQISDAKLSPDQDSTSEIPNFKPTPTHDLVREKIGKRSIQVSVVAWDQSGPKLRYKPTVQFLDKRLSVPKLLPTLSESLVLPTDLEDYGTTRDLFDDIRDLLKRYVTMFKNQDELLAYWCVASWFPDALDFVPRLTITGPSFSADVLFQVLRCVSRRPVLLAGMNSAVLKTIPINELKPTLLIRETRLSQRKAELLDALDQKGYFIASGADLRQFYCAKCVYLGEDHIREAGVPGGIHVHVGDIRLPALQLPTDSEIEEFQNKLFRYRSFHYDRVKLSRFAAQGPLPELRAVAQQLGSAIVGDDDLQKRIIGVLKEQSEQARVDRSSGLKAMVLRSVLSHCHEGDQQQVFARDLAITVNQLYSKEGESLKVSCERVGHVLKSLGLYSRRLGNGGRGLLLDKSTQVHAHELSHAYDVLPAVPECGYCLGLQSQQ